MIGPYLLALGSLLVFSYLLRGADTAGGLAAMALAALVWWWAENRRVARERRRIKA